MKATQEQTCKTIQKRQRRNTYSGTSSCNQDTLKQGHFECPISDWNREVPPVCK